MFSPDHAIWRFAYAGDELDDWLPYAEELIQKWSQQSCNEVKFQNTFEIVLAAYLLKDDLLPASARIVFAETMLKTITEADLNKLRLKCLHIHPPEPGRKRNPVETFFRWHEVNDLIQNGKTATEAYYEVAEKHFKSPDTIRREYERISRKTRERKKNHGENDQ